MDKGLSARYSIRQKRGEADPAELPKMNATVQVCGCAFRRWLCPEPHQRALRRTQRFSIQFPKGIVFHRLLRLIRRLRHGRFHFAFVHALREDNRYFGDQKKGRGRGLMH
jgi:hypothetical protein